MALSPGIPTSFVPHQPVQPTAKRPLSSGYNLFLVGSLIVAGIATVAAIGIFAYDKYLLSTLASKQAQLAEAQSKVNENTIEDFVRLRDRLSNGKDLLSNHVLLSQFFDTLEGLTLQNVRFSDLKLVVAGDHTAKIQMKGSAKNFNALAAQSNTFAGEKRIKRAIFSNISIDSNKLVSFELTADVDPKLIIQGNSISSQSAAKIEVQTTAAALAVPVASTTTASTTKPAAPKSGSTTPPVPKP